MPFILNSTANVTQVASLVRNEMVEMNYSHYPLYDALSQIRRLTERISHDVQVYDFQLRMRQLIDFRNDQSMVNSLCEIQKMVNNEQRTNLQPLKIDVQRILHNVDIYLHNDLSHLNG